MAAGMALTAAQSLFAALQSTELREICSMFGFKTDLEELKETASTIKAVLLDADSKQGELSHGARDWIDKLKDVVYDVDDLLDEFNTIIQRKKHQNNISEKVRRFFSRSNQLILAFNTSLNVKKIKKKLDAVASDHSKFGLSVNYEPIRKTRKETGSYVHDGRIIGREVAKEEVVGLLLQNSNVQEDVSFVTIVGIGGLGKTALAQLVYDDDRIKKDFQLSLWVCVSEEFGVKEILSKMLMSATDQKSDDLGIDQLQRKVREKIEGQRYFLVLDDVWAESRNEWVDLREFLIRGGRGSRILVTTRSKLVATAIGNGGKYELPGLSDKDSWVLFARMAFEEGEEQADASLVEIGKEIVKRCANVPLSIRVIGSFLYGQDKRKWQLFNKVNLSKIKNEEDDTMAVLKFSYYQLTPPLKSCFSYCTLFPKDHLLEKDQLISLWSALGCIEPRYEGQSIEDAGEEYFSVLLNRCFFQDVKKDIFGDIYECKMHDLMHDLAQEVAGNESLKLSSTSQFNRNFRHVSITKGCRDLFNVSECLSQMKTTRTFLQIQARNSIWPPSKLLCQSNAPLILSSCRYLRVLDLRNCLDKTLPSITGELVHLRYLDLSYNSDLKMLPESITKLHNLQFLRLDWCRGLRFLPKDLSKLVNLRELSMKYCDKLTHMPVGMDKMTCLHTLSMFVVGETNSKQTQAGQLEDLKALVNLGGELCVAVNTFDSKEASEVREKGYMLSKLHLKRLRIHFNIGAGKEDVEEALLEGLQPADDLREIGIWGYRGVKLPSWASMENSLITSLPCLVRVSLDGLPRLLHLPSLSQLRHLKSLSVKGIPNVEYMEEGNMNNNSGRDVASSWSSRGATEFIFFPSLEMLDLDNMHKLKGWWRSDIVRVDGEAQLWPQGSEVEDGNERREKPAAAMNYDDVMPRLLLVFPCLVALDITRCPNLKSFPPCPHLHFLKLVKVNEEFSFSEKILKSGNITSSITPTINSSSSSNLSLPTPSVQLCDENDSIIAFAGTDDYSQTRICGLNLLTIDKVGGYMNFLPEESTRGSPDLQIQEYEEESLSTFGVLFQNYASSLQYLYLQDCGNLKSLDGGVLEHLTNLHSLSIEGCENLAFKEEDDDDNDGMQPWKSLQTLTYLCLGLLPKLVNLPKGIQCLTALQTLRIYWCNNLIALPEWLSCLTSLKSLCIDNCLNLKSLPEAMRHLPSLSRLEIRGCSGLTERCRCPNGMDWPKIQYIRHLIVEDEDEDKRWSLF